MSAKELFNSLQKYVRDQKTMLSILNFSIIINDNDLSTSLLTDFVDLGV